MIVATALFELDHVPAAVAFDNAVVDPAQIEVVPVLAAKVGNEFTVTVVADEVA